MFCLIEWRFVLKSIDIYFQNFALGVNTFYKTLTLRDVFYLTWFYRNCNSPTFSNSTMYLSRSLVYCICLPAQITISFLIKSYQDTSVWAHLKYCVWQLTLNTKFKVNNRNDIVQHNRIQLCYSKLLFNLFQVTSRFVAYFIKAYQNNLFSATTTPKHQSTLLPVRLFHITDAHTKFSHDHYFDTTNLPIRIIRRWLFLAWLHLNTEIYRWKSPKLNTLTTQKRTFAEVKRIYWCIYNGTSD